MDEGELMKGTDEKKTCELLGIPWRASEDRNVTDLCIGSNLRSSGFINLELLHG